MSLYTTTEGRIGRQQWWMGVIVLAVVFIVVGVLAGLLMRDQPAILGWVNLILFAIFAYPLYALYLKRRHDRDNNGLDAIIYLAVIAVSALLAALGITMSPQEMPGVGTVMMPNAIGSIVGAILFIYGIYMLVQMGFLRGTVGPNQYGPDPVGMPATA